MSAPSASAAPDPTPVPSSPEPLPAPPAADFMSTYFDPRLVDHDQRADTSAVETRDR